MADSHTSILRIEDLRVEAVVKTRRRRARQSSEILRGVSLTVEKGTMMGLVGESGSGKSMTARAIMRQLPRSVVVTGGRILLDGDDLSERSVEEIHKIRGGVVGMIFQNPRAALHPMLSVGRQMGEVVKTHRADFEGRAHDLICQHLDLCGLSDPERVVRAYPHELSGGMAQRVLIATALLPEPRLLLADEPTTGLDATIQRRVLELLRDLQQRLDLTVLLITHDLGIVAHFCDRAAVMCEGEVVETGTRHEVLTNPKSDYARKLIAGSRLDELGEPLVQTQT
jgi:ABC-type dipeptide/oligopeptide/nickel transport system ATPase component